MTSSDKTTLNYGETLKHWTASLDGNEYRIHMLRQFWTGERKYFVNDELIAHTKPGLANSARFSDDVSHKIAGHEIRFRYRAVGRVAFFDLFVDGEKIEGSETSALRFHPMIAVILTMLLLGMAAMSMLAN